MELSTPTTRWDGGVSPYGVSWQKLMMWWFIITDALLFAGFLASYGYSRASVDSWPDRSQVFNMRLITVMTFVLISSSATMATAVLAARRGDTKRVGQFLLMTLAGGVIFLGMQAFEWNSLISEGARPDSNPWGEPAFGAYFFLITGFHGTHVLIGALVILIVALKAIRGKVTAEGVEMAGLYWHFVDLVWVFVFGCFYLL
jgi:cytochrome c oxidase subunit 3